MSKYQIPGYQINPNDTLHKRGRDAPNVPLHEIQKQLLEYLGTFEAVQEAEEEIEKKYSIKKGITGLWPIDDIKKAWGKTLRMNWQWPFKKNKRAHWSIVIILQMLLQIKESEYDATKTQSKIKEGLTASKSYDSPEETQYYSKHSAGNLSEETKPRREGKWSKKDLENSEKDDLGKKRTKADTTDNIKNASEKFSSPNYDSCSRGFYIPLTELKATNLQQDINNQEENTRFKLIDGEPKNLDKNLDNNRYELSVKTSHVVKYNKETDNAAWVFEILNKETINGPAKKKYNYRLDAFLEGKSLNSYAHTGYDRGHLAAAANHMWCQKANDDTFFLSNIVPQCNKINRGKWRQLEDLCRLYVQDQYSKAYIYTGPLYCSEKYMTENASTQRDLTEETIDNFRRDFRSDYGKDLPTHFFKVIILEKDNGERDLKCYEIPNHLADKNNHEITDKQKEIQRIEQKLSVYSKTIGHIETFSRLRFTENISEIRRNREEVKTVTFTGDTIGESISTNVKIIPI